ncbi:HupE/UreJ family protein [Calothrix rhizosoleniae]|uniref:HupE/UreJ family protein n=1 Tax=Calothrix rhizosoleniae TaxID=888997 RepID=UPI000B49C9B1|nr:HupE/UreJ family protein [Calothrix rhizosoleniae]
MKTKWRKHRLSIIFFCLSLLLSIGFSTPTLAHWADLSVAEIIIDQKQTVITLTLPTSLVAFGDDNRDGQLSHAETAIHKTELEQFLGDKVSLTDNIGQKGVLTVASSKNLPPNIQTKTNTHTSLELTYTWFQPVIGLKINYDLFAPNISTARCLATVIQGEKTQNLVFTPEQREFNLINTPIHQQISSFVLLGIEHILTGYDHILFLISLLMMGGGLGYLLKVITAFTISHSVTLSLAVLNIVSLPVSFVESAIALTIVYVAVENFWRKGLRWRWLLTLTFGLIHGLGFAGVFQKISLTPSSLDLSLVSFNIGVELGQIIIVSITFVLLQTLRKYPWELTFRRLVSACIAATGLFWFLQRAWGVF